MIIVTGAAGFIGSCIVAKLNERGHKDIIAVDDWDEAVRTEKGSEPPSAENVRLKKENLANKQTAGYFDKTKFLNLIKKDRLEKDVECLIHMGACSSTTLQDPKYFEENNFLYSRHLAEWALKYKVPLIYASSAATYGDGSAGCRDDENTIRRCRPLNLYGQSKQKFDLWILDNGFVNQVVGLKFFNVFGPNEYHKGEMQSVVAKSYSKAAEEGRIRLFKSHKKEYADGGQKRDFIYVKDAVDVVMFFFDHPQIHGIFNVGTGEAHSWNELAAAIFAAAGRTPQIEYFDMPKHLRERYQYFTQADITKLRRCGYSKSFTPLNEAVKDYAGYLKDRRHW